MASIVIAGDTSGSVTISAPAIAGTPTLTLPTTSGTLVVTGGAQTVQFAAGSAASPSITFTGDTNTGIFSPTADTIAFSEGGVESMRIDSSGNVGIGTTAPSSSAGKLVVSGVANVYGDERKILNLIDTTALATGVGAGISFWGTSESGGGTSQFGSIKGVKENATSANYAGALAFVTSNSSNVQTERMRITSAGNVGIGTSSPAYQLSMNKAGSNYIEINNSSALITSYYGTSDNGAWVGTSSSHPTIFYTAGNERARFNAGAPILCLSGGNTSATGTGIAFPATQSASSDANTLDDYEEGTWTPTNNSDATGNLSGATGEYVKVGRIVYVRGCVTVSSNFTNHILGGLPFTFSGANTVSGITGGCVAFNSSAATLFATPATDSTQIYFYTNANTANQNGLNTTNATIRFYFVYRTSS